MRAELAKPIALEAGRRIQFEVDDFFFGVTLCATEETILPGDWLRAFGKNEPIGAPAAPW
jgi:hypothetical protein